MKDDFDSLTPNLKKLYTSNWADKAFGKLSLNVQREAKKNVMHSRNWNGKKQVISNKGDLAKSILSKKISPGVHAVGVTEKYGVFVHEGTKPHYPPFKPIFLWVKQKLRLEDPEAKKVTVFIQKKIAEEGTEGRPFLADALEKELKMENIEKVMKKELINELVKIIK